MAAGAGDVRLQLGVTLDLAGFRQQLAAAARAAASFYYPINFDKRNLDRQFAAIDKQFKRRNYRLEIITNFAAEIENANKLIGKIQQVKQAAQSASGGGGGLSIGLVNTAGLGLTPSRGGVGKNDIKALYESLAIAGVEGFERGTKKTRDKMIEQIGTVGQDTVAGLLNGLKSQDAALKAAAENLGMTLITTFKAILGIASPSKVFKGFGDDVGKGFEQGALNAMDKAFDALENLARQRLRILDTIARGAFRMLGMDPAAMLAQERQRRLPPAINWPSEVPRRPFTGPSSTGRLLSPGAAYGALPGFAAVNQKRLVGDILSPSLKEALRGAANAFADAVRAELNAAVRSVSVRDLGNAARAALLPGRIAGYLPAGVGRTSSPYSTGFLGRDGESRAERFARREREARMRSALREVDVMGGEGARAPSPYSYAYRSARPLSAIVPYARGGALVPQLGGGGQGGGGGGNRPPRGGGGGMGSGGFGRALAGVQLPGAGVIREIGTEFAFATKQVLLYGQAYKLLAFAQDFPTQVGAAVGQLQSFRNTLAAISPTAKEAAMSNEFILDIVDRYNIPLQSAREGFTKLYASMAPAGFKGGEIRNIFTGISQAAATFGMSSDKVDRMNYAFAQMASKGQVMSEELKGQLGDVLPGAMAIFTKAAGFDGPQAIAKFSKALEDGAYKGDAMKQLLLNVGVVMRKEFGAGAEGAALTFQGVINRLQNSMKLLYESFEPVAVGFLNTVVMPLTNGIKTVTDGFNAFFTGTQAKTVGGAAFAQELAQLKPSLEGIGKNLQELIPIFQTFGSVLLNIGKILASIAGNPITGFLLKIYANILLVNTVFTLLGGRVLMGVIASIGSTISRFIALNASIASLQRTSSVANSSLAGTQLQMALLTRNASAALGPLAMLRTAMLGLARFGLIAIAVEVAISGMSELDRLKKSLDDIAGFSSKEYRKQVKGLSREEVNSRIIVNRRSQSQVRKELSQFSGPLGAAKGLTTGRDEELRARLAMQQVQEAVLMGARSNPTQAQLNQRAIGGGVTQITGQGSETARGSKSKTDKAAKEAERLREQIAQQAQAAADALFSEQQRLLVLEQTNPIAESIAKFTSQEAIIQRELNAALKEAKSEKEKADRKQEASLKSSANALELEKAIKDVRTQALKPIEDLLASQREQLVYEADYKQLLKEGVNPEVAKQVAEVRKLVRTQLEVFDLAIKNAKTAITEAEARGASADAVAKLRKELTGLEEDRKKAEGRGKEAETGVAKAEGPKSAMDYLKDGAEAARKELEKLSNFGYQLTEAAGAIGNAFGTAFKQIITGSSSVQEAFANMFSSVADHFADMVAKMIAEWLKAQLIQGFMNIVGALIPGMGAAGGMLGAGAGGAAGFGGSFSSGIAPLPNVPNYASAFGARKFANGGIVTGPTMGLIGEGRYNEAVVPLPNGRSIPVELGGASAATNVIVNVDAKGTSVAGDQGAAQSLAKDLASVVDQRIIYHKRAGGLLSR